MSQRRPPRRSRWCGLIVSLVCLEAAVASAYVVRNSAEFSLLRLGFALEDRDASRGARYLSPDLVSVATDGIAQGYALQIGSWRAFPDGRALGALQTNQETGSLEVHGSCGGKAVSADVRLRRIDAGRADFGVVQLPLYDWRIVSVTPASLCHVARECLSPDEARASSTTLRCDRLTLLASTTGGSFDQAVDSL